jgi:UDP-glucuronate 4-epimerase
MKNKNIIITGSSGFIGYHICLKFLSHNYCVYGIDNHNNYYDPNIKQARLNKLRKFKNFKFFKFDIKNKKKLDKVFLKAKPEIIIHLAAQAGVRYSFINPQAYIDSNITGFTNILEIMKNRSIKKLIFASSSSVYGDCKKFPFKEDLNLNPLNFYGQTKLMNEKIADIYKKNYGISTIGLRFFTVYGPYGRPDMFIPKIIKKIKNNQVLELYNNGNHYRDFTFVEDVAGIVFKITKKINLNIKEHFFNICNGNEINIKYVVSKIEKMVNKKIKIVNKPFQRGDMKKTYGDNKLIIKKFKFEEFTNFETGLVKTLKTDYFNV